MAVATQPVKFGTNADRFIHLTWNVWPGMESSITSGNLSSNSEVIPGTMDREVIEQERRSGVDELEAFYSGITGSSVMYIPFTIMRTSSINPDEGMAQLIAATETGEELIFVQVLERIDWRSRDAQNYVYATQLALSISAYASARRLVAEAFHKFPDHPAVQKMARILSPPKAIPVRRDPDSSLQANRDWFARHSQEYRGQWVALKDGRLLAAASTLKELKSLLPDWHQTTVTQVNW